MTKILVIEDEEPIRENLLELLEAEDFETLGAPDGKTGIQLATENRPDLILCDVMMPEIDGYGVLKALRKTPETATIPFIFLTALADKSENRKGMEMGADDYLTKPCTPNELLNAIASRLEKQAVFERQQSQKLDDLRNNILLSLPHELRTPLNGILGFSELLLHDCETMDRAEMREMIEHIQLSGKRLYRLIQNYLLYAELELISTDSERMKALRNCQINSADSIITEAAKNTAKEAEREADLLLNIEDSSLPIAATRLQKIVEELVENAFKFSEPGMPVTVSSFVENKNFLLSITDRGRGMTAQQIADIGAYMQFERKLYEQQGSGLGLAIAKRLTELHGGNLTIKSSPEVETTVLINLPL